jgi:mannose-6-phosphate isomerase-like protein (cupin superfamily)
MLYKNGTTNVEVRKSMREGPGEVTLRHLCAVENRPAKCRMFAEVTLEPGCGIGMHQHIGESEFFYCISGTGTAIEDGKEVALEKGDCLLTPGGGTHNLTNNGTETLVLVACVVLD